MSSSSTRDQKQCPICGSVPLSMTSDGRNDVGPVSKINCRRCGTFRVEDFALDTGLTKSLGGAKHLVSAYVRRQNKAGIEPLFTYSEYVENKDMSRFEHMGFPDTVPAKLDALLRAYGRQVKGHSGRGLKTDKPSLIAEVAAEDAAEIGGLTQLLGELGWVNVERNVIAAKGWARIDELRRSSPQGDSGFIAMWFDPATQGLRKPLAAAVEGSGYRAVLIDEVDYTGFVMDQVMAQIRAARFVVADFTCEPEDDAAPSKTRKGVRGGVYWEAGFAYGLGKAVIHTCMNSKDAKRRTHFDVEQYNTIFWDPGDLSIEIRDTSKPIDNPTFADKLTARILAVVGRGPRVATPAQDRA